MLRIDYVLISISYILLITNLITKICLNNFRAVSKEEYPYKIYPPYCQGALYLFDIHTSEQLCHLFEMELHRNYVWIEDVFITGNTYLLIFFYSWRHLISKLNKGKYQCYTCETNLKFISNDRHFDLIYLTLHFVSFWD